MLPLFLFLFLILETTASFSLYFSNIYYLVNLDDANLREETFAMDCRNINSNKSESHLKLNGSILISSSKMGNFFLKSPKLSKAMVISSFDKFNKIITRSSERFINEAIIRSTSLIRDADYNLKS